MRVYRYFLDIDQPAARVWAIMQDYDRWGEFAGPFVTGVTVAKPGDAAGNGLVRHVNYRLPLGLHGNSIETISDLVPGVGYTYTSVKGTAGDLRLEKLDEGCTRLHFEERLKLEWPFSWFEGPLRRFMEKYNRKTMLNMGAWLADHPEYGR